MLLCLHLWCRFEVMLLLHLMLSGDFFSGRFLCFEQTFAFNFCIYWLDLQLFPFIAQRWFWVHFALNFFLSCTETSFGFALKFWNSEILHWIFCKFWNFANLRQIWNFSKIVAPQQHLPSPEICGERLLRPRQLYSSQGALAQLGQRIRSAPSMATTQNGPDSGQPVIRSPSGIKEALLKWCQVKTKGYPNVNVTNFSSSWADGMAFCALIHHFVPDSFDFKILDPRNRRANFDLAFKVAEERCGIVPLLETDDMLMMGNKPDYKCVFTYVQSIYKCFRNQD